MAIGGNNYNVLVDDGHIHIALIREALNHYKPITPTVLPASVLSYKINVSSFQ